MSPGLHRPGRTQPAASAVTSAESRRAPHGSVGALSASHEAACLRFDPFSGDRDSDVRQLRDRFVTTRFKHKCSYCFTEIIAPRTRVRALTEVNREDGKVMTFHFCVPCCLAMATHLADDGDALEERAALASKASCRRSRR